MRSSAADIASVAVGGDHELADGGGVAQPEIEALRADRRDHVRGFADQRDAPRAEAPRGLDRERKHAAAGLDRDLAQDRMRAALDLLRQVGIGKRGERAALRAGSATNTRLDRCPGSGTSVNGPASVWNSVEVSRCGRLCARLQVSAVCG